MDLLNCGSLRSEQLASSMAQSAANEAVLTGALRRLLGVQFKLGM